MHIQANATQTQGATLGLNIYKKYNGAILSLGGYWNYGSIVQRYALQEFLKQKGYRFKQLNLSLMSGFNRERHRNTLEFFNKYIDHEELTLPPVKHYKTYIVGSDQVWRDWGYGWDKFGKFFLDFVEGEHIRRVAYAASFGEDTLSGANINQIKISKIRPLLEKFDAVSVREDSGVKMVKSICGKKVVKLLDPTLLLDSNHYSRIIDHSPFKSQQIAPLFCYILDKTANKDKFTNTISESTNQPIFGIYPNNNQPLPHVEIWLKGFRDSKLVVTDSFHGIIFSIINQRQFLVIGNHKRGLARMSELLGSLGLEGRLIPENKLDDFKYDNLTDIDWGGISIKIVKMKCHSSQWLVESLH